MCLTVCMYGSGIVRVCVCLVCACVWLLGLLIDGLCVCWVVGVQFVVCLSVCLGLSVHIGCVCVFVCVSLFVCV